MRIRRIAFSAASTSDGSAALQTGSSKRGRRRFLAGDSANSSTSTAHLKNERTVRKAYRAVFVEMGVRDMLDESLEVGTSRVEERDVDELGAATKVSFVLDERLA